MIHKLGSITIFLLINFDRTKYYFSETLGDKWAKTYTTNRYTIFQQSQSFVFPDFKTNDYTLNINNKTMVDNYFLK